MTGVQTCALPICLVAVGDERRLVRDAVDGVRDRRGLRRDDGGDVLLSEELAAHGKIKLRVDIHEALAEDLSLAAPDSGGKGVELPVDVPELYRL